jgi:hypothetical protein
MKSLYQPTTYERKIVIPLLIKLISTTDKDNPYTSDRINYLLRVDHYLNQSNYSIQRLIHYLSVTNKLDDGRMILTSSKGVYASKDKDDLIEYRKRIKAKIKRLKAIELLIKETI